MLINFTKWITVALFFSVADPGFPVGWDGGVPSHGGRGEERQPPMQVLFDKDGCKNERIESHWGEGAPPGSANGFVDVDKEDVHLGRVANQSRVPKQLLFNNFRSESLNI